MTEQEQTKWCSVLNETELGDIININGLCVKVEEDVERTDTCRQCAFHVPDNEDYCGLNLGRGVTPCSPFNNHIGKALIFYKI